MAEGRGFELVGRWAGVISRRETAALCGAGSASTGAQKCAALSQEKIQARPYKETAREGLLFLRPLRGETPTLSQTSRKRTGSSRQTGQRCDLEGTRWLTPAPLSRTSETFCRV